MAINYSKEVTCLPILLQTLKTSQYSEPVKHFSRFRVWICLWRWMSKNFTLWTVAFKNRHKLHAGPPTQMNHNIFTARFSRTLCPNPCPRCMFKETRKQNIFSYKSAPYLTPFSRSVFMSSQQIKNILFLKKKKLKYVSKHLKFPTYCWFKFFWVQDN